MPIDHVNALPPGTRFEEYRLDAVLGAGGFGITYRAYDANLDKFVAIKEYLPNEFATRAERYTVVPQSSTDAQDYHWGLNRFLDEARTLARFDHPHLNKVYRFFESNGSAYMVLEYIQGETLADRLTRERQLPEESLQRLLEEVLSGLAVMHEAGYVHRDIKPGNLMLREENGSVVVLDFGAARQAVGQRSKAITSILTPGYAPVEQYDGKVDRVGAWTDIYALGMVAYRCISGIGDNELPDAVARMLAHSKGGTTLLPAVEAGKGKYNAKFLEAIDWAIEVDEEDRPQTMDVWRHALAGGGRGKDLTKSVRKPETKIAKGAPTERVGTGWPRAALTALIGVLLGTGAWWAWQEYPQLFGEGSDATQKLSQQAATTGVPGETLQETESGEPGEAMGRTEQSPSPEKTETKQSASREPALSPEEAEVTRLLAAAEADLKARRLTSPAGNNAWDNYMRVLELVPAHPEAIGGMERVIHSYMELFGMEVEKEDFDKAAGYLVKIGELHPDSPVLDEGVQRLNDAKQARADRLAEQERQRQADLEKQRVEQAIEGHWKTFEAALGEDNLNEATSILNQLRALSPEEPGLAQGEARLAELERKLIDRVIKEHWAAFEAAMEVQDLDEAASLLTQVRALNPEYSGLAEGEQRLAAAQAALEQQLREVEEKLKQLVGEMVDIPGGTFRMGDLDGSVFWKPVRSVTVAAFRMGKYEVTVGQFRRFVDATGYRTDVRRDAGDRGDCWVEVSGFWGPRWERSTDHNWQNPGYAVDETHPAVCVSRYDAQAFTEWLSTETDMSFRLPTEAEWEYAARAGSTTKYHFGNSESQMCRYDNHADSSTDFDSRNESCSDGVSKRTALVGSYQPNSFGLHDMHGNVSEWVQDCWNDSYSGAPTDGSAWMQGECDYHVYRGGSWRYGATSSAFRYRSSPSISRDSTRGFRLAQDK